MATTNQVKKGVKKTKPKKRVPNPTGKGGFKDNPDNRSPGGWKKEMVFSWQYKRFMNMTIDELRAYSRLSSSQRTVVEDLAYNRVVAAKRSLPDVREITDRTEGKAQQSIDLTTGGEPMTALVEFIEAKPNANNND